MLLSVRNDPLEKNDDLRQLMAEMGEEQLCIAQEYLRGVMVKQAKALLNGKLLRGSRIQRPEEFEKYFK
jgi:hypothetical protein